MSAASFHYSLGQQRLTHASTLNTKWRSSRWIEIFVLFQIACQIGLLFGPAGTMRVVARVAAYGGCLVLLFLLPTVPGAKPHPSTAAAHIVLLILVLSFFHPLLNGFGSGGTQVLLYFAIVAPLLWVPRLRIDPLGLRRVMMILWLFHTASACVGVLQVYYPGSFEPNVSQIVSSSGLLSGLSITLANGQRILRPMGLTDIPGGASLAGFYSVIFGIGFFMTSRRLWLLMLSVMSMIVGMICLYVSQVRSLLVMTLICIIALCALLLLNRRGPKLVQLLAVLPVVMVASFAWAVVMGGNSVTDRLNTLVEGQATDVYYRNRGIFLQHTLDELIPLYPLGAGLGRWGMTNAYFGDNSDSERGHIHVEIQWTGWLLDGGIPLILAYCAAIGVALSAAWRIARQRAGPNDGGMPIWAALVLAYNVGAIALTFNYPVFIGELGLEFWLLNAALFTAAHAVYPELNNRQQVER